jgi:hypothetical protein
MPFTHHPKIPHRYGDGLALAKPAKLKQKGSVGCFVEKIDRDLLKI